MHRYPAPGALTGLVRWYWIPIWSVPTGRPSVQRVLQYPVSLLVVTADYARFYGVSTGLSETVLEGDGWAAGVTCTPAAGSLIARGSMAAFTDRHVDVGEVLGRAGAELTDRVRTAMHPDPHAVPAHQAEMDAFGDVLRPLLPLDHEGELVNRLVGAGRGAVRPGPGGAAQRRDRVVRARTATPGQPSARADPEVVDPAPPSARGRRAPPHEPVGHHGRDGCRAGVRRPGPLRPRLRTGHRDHTRQVGGRAPSSRSRPSASGAVGGELDRRSE